MTMRAVVVGVAALCAAAACPITEASQSSVVVPEAMPPLLRKPTATPKNMTEQLLKLKRPSPLSPEEQAEETLARKERIRERNERARRKIQSYVPTAQDVERMTPSQLENVKEEPWMRRLWGNGDSTGAWADFFADPSQDYDKWQQAYRMLGGYIDCDHQKEDDNHSGDNSGDNNNNGDDGDGSSACSRWMVWAAYVDPDYSGNEYYEYFGDEPTGVLDCHSPDTSWQLLGVYRQEFYQYIEQISKHLWAIDEYEYIVALAGLAYMTDYDCWYVSSDNSGNSIYAGVAPKANGEFQMALYTDGGMCLTPDDSLGMTFDDLGLTSNMKLESGDGDDAAYDDDSMSQAYEWWSETQEYTLTNLNDVYTSFKYCTSCVDYPTYQDGYFIGDDGTDDDDLINQCWKFHSHDSFYCDSDCIGKAHAQGTILAITYNGQTFGSTPSSFYDASYASNGSITRTRNETKMTKLMANVFVAFSFIVFVATFLAFAVARRSRQREKRSSKSRRLLDDDRGSRASRRRRSHAAGPDGDGLFRQSRSKSVDGRSRSGSKRSKSVKSGKSRSKSSSRHHSASRRQRESGAYEPPKERGSGDHHHHHKSEHRESKHHRSSSRGGGERGSSSRRPLDDF